MLVLLALTSAASGQAVPIPTVGLGFLAEEGGTFLQAHTTVSKSLNVNYLFAIDDTTLTEAFAKIKLLSEDWTKAPAVKAAQLEKRLISALENFKATSNYLRHSMLARGKAGKIDENACNFFPQVLTVADLDAVTRLRKDFDALASTANRESLENFADSVDNIAFYWLSITSATLYELDSMRAGMFPLTLRGKIEISPCLADIIYESIFVQSCTAGEKFFYCTLVYRYPTEIRTFERLASVTHDNILLQGTRDNVQYAKDSTGTLNKFVCDAIDRTLPQSTPVCKQILGEKECLEGLQKNYLKDIVKYCKFEQKMNRNVIQFATATLVEDCEASLLVNDKPFFPKLDCPYLIESTGKVIVNSKGRDYLMENQGKTDKVLIASIDSATIASLRTQMYLERLFGQELRAFDFITISIGTSLLLLLIVKLALCIFKKKKKQTCGCKRCGYANANSPHHRGKRNYTQNKRLLTLPAGGF